jgi:hypothetical protein
MQRLVAEDVREKLDETIVVCWGLLGDDVCQGEGNRNGRSGTWMCLAIGLQHPGRTFGLQYRFACAIDGESRPPFSPSPSWNVCWESAPLQPYLQWLLDLQRFDSTRKTSHLLCRECRE